jgi:YD repeat-containing protein
MRTSSTRTLAALAVLVLSITTSTPTTAAMPLIEVPLASCVAPNATAPAPYGGPTPPEWQSAGELSCVRWAAAHLPSGFGCGDCPQNGMICSIPTSCVVQKIDPGYVGGATNIPGTVLLAILGLAPCNFPYDAGLRGTFTCSCPAGARFDSNSRCRCDAGTVWNATTNACIIPTNCSGSIAEGQCFPSPVKPGKDCVDCPARGDVTAGTNPINVATGMKFERETVYRAAGDHGLSVSTVFTSGTSLVGMPARSGVFGRNRTSGFDRRFSEAVNILNVTYVIATRPDGRRFDFRRNGAALIADADVADRLEQVYAPDAQSEYRYTTTDDIVEAYNFDGVLMYEDNRHGRRLKYTYSNGSGGHISSPGLAHFGYVSPACNAPSGWVYQVNRADVAEGVLPAWRMMCVTDHFGRQLHFQYDRSGRVTRIADLAGGIHKFAYDGASGGCDGDLNNLACTAGNLTSVTFPDTKVRTYHYNELDKVNGGTMCPGKSAYSPGRSHLPNHLTGLIDENGDRYGTWTYDCNGRATSSEHAGGADKIVIAYDTPNPGQSTVSDYRVDTNTVNQERVYSFAVSHGVTRNTVLSHPNDRTSGTKSYTYDANGNIASRLDWKLNRTNYTYDLTRNLETSRTEGLTEAGGATAETRTISTEWHSTFRLATKIAEPRRLTTFVYDLDGSQCGARGALCSKTLQSTTDQTGAQGLTPTVEGTPRTWTHTYNADGKVLTINGPRTDVADITNYTYYANDDADFGKRGNLATITNAASHLTSVTEYNAHGQPLRIIDPSGMTIVLTYDERQRLKTKSDGGELTSYDYDDVGQLIKVTRPDGSLLNYDYNPAHQLVEIADNVGNRIAYGVDVMGNRKLEQVFDEAIPLLPVQKRARVYSNLNRLFQDLGAQNPPQTTEYSYDGQGSVESVKDPLNNVTSNEYDALNRLKKVTSPSPVLGVTQYAYNGLDELIQVTDPKNLITKYTVDGLGNRTKLESPDTDTTLYTHDAAGNVLSETDKVGNVRTYTYDVLNRASTITYTPPPPNQANFQTETYAYDDAGTNGIGRLRSITETNASSQVTAVAVYGYNLHGRVASETRTINGVQYVVGYAYDSWGRLSGIAYPSGRTLTYAFDTLGRIIQVTTTKDNQSVVVVQDVSYHPFGGVRGYTLGNGRVYTRGIDLDGRIASYTLGGETFELKYDLASRIDRILYGGNENLYEYDELDRLKGAIIPGTPYGYTYDAVGNRTEKRVSGIPETYTYSTTSNRIATVGSRAFTFDLNGATTGDGNNTYTYDMRRRMVQAISTLGTTTYQINALGQRVRKTNTFGDRVFHYDIGGRLIAETDPAGGLKRELIYLGDIPVGVVQ